MAAEPPAELTIVPPGARAMLTLGHGAGSPMTSPLLQGLCESLRERGIATHRFNFPYMRAGRRAPDRAPVLLEAFRAAHERAGAAAPGLPLLAGGRSMGGRIASMAAADGMPAAGLVFLAYPLHPPGRPERIRDAHLYGLDIPMLFIQGSRDAFARPELLRAVLSRLGTRAHLVEIDGADHGFRRAGGTRDAASIGAALAEPVAAFVDQATAASRA
ncbi:MAG TPA: alpha/beta family hydrolase [Gaiellales bacterium]